MKKIARTLSLLAVALFCLSCSEDDAGLPRKPEWFDVYKNRWNRYNETGDYDSIIKITCPFFEKSLSENDTMAVLYSGVMLAQAYLFSDRSDSVEYYLDLISPYEINDSYPQVGVVLNNILGIMSLKERLDYTEAMHYYREGLKWAEKGNDASNQIIFLVNIVKIFYLRGDEYGINYAERAFGLSKSPGADAYSKTMALISMSEMKILSEEYTEAGYYADEAGKLICGNNFSSLASVLDLIRADIAYGMGNPDEAEEYYLDALEASENLEAGYLSMLFLKTGDLKSELGKYDEAEAAYKKGLEISYRYNSVESRKGLLQRLSDLFYMTGDKEKAYEYFREYEGHIDSVSAVRHGQEFNNMLLSYQRVEHEKQMYEKEIQLLRANRSVIVSVLVLLCIAILSLSFYMMLSKQRKMYNILVRRYNNYIDRTERLLHPSVSEKSDCGDYELFQRIEKCMSRDGLYRIKDLTVEKLAEMVGSNRTYISRCINKFSGMTFYGYLDSYRVREAVKLIASLGKDMTFKHIADEVGYNSVSVFYRAFQKETGCTPGNYRNGAERIRSSC